MTRRRTSCSSPPDQPGAPGRVCIDATAAILCVRGTCRASTGCARSWRAVSSIDHTGPEDDPRVATAVPEDRSTRATRAISNITASAGSFPAILVAIAFVVLWCGGAAFVPSGFHNTGYQLVVSTVSSVVTLIMVFIIQSSQNRDSRALQAKVDAMANALTHMSR